jgi:hypothetical protein
VCVIISWGAYESFMHPIFVLKNGCDTITQYGPFYLFVIQWYSLQNIHFNLGGVNTFKLNTRYCTSMCVSDFRDMQSILHAFAEQTTCRKHTSHAISSGSPFLCMIDLVRARGVLWVTCRSNQGLDFNFCFSPLALSAKQIKKKINLVKTLNRLQYTVICWLYIMNLDTSA